MADPKTFTLIGEFKDGITPELTKINKQLANLSKSLGSLGGKGSRRTARDMGRFTAALNGVNQTLKTQNQVLRSTIVPMRQYRREVGKTIGALKRLDQLGGGSIAIERTNKALKEQIRLMDQLNSRRGRSRMAPPGGGGIRPGRAGGGRGGRGPRGGGDGYDFHMGGFAFGYELGQGLARPLTSVLMSGFTAGAALIKGTFRYFAGTVGERVKDEMEDISAAGGYYSIAKRQGDKSFLGKDPSLDRALEFTEGTNRILGNLAKDLPGATRDYVMVSKRIGDSVARVVESDAEGAAALAKKLKVGNEAYYKDAEKGAAGTVQVLLGELTKKSVMAGLGGTTGRGGPAGPYGLPGLTERLLTDQGISEAQLGKYASVYGDPKVSAAIGRLMPKLKEAGGDMVKRLDLINSFYDEIVPEAMVQKMRRSTSGLMEALNSAIFDPEIGFLGLGRKLKGFGYKMNDFGEYLDEAGNVVGTASEAARVDIDLFKMFRDILANVFMVLQPIVDNLSMIWDPLKEIGGTLTNARHYTAEFYKSFQRYEKGLMDYQQTLSKAGAEKFGQTRKLRASLLAIGNMFAELGVISDADFGGLVEKIKDPNVDLGAIFSGMLAKFFSSDAAKEVGEVFGTLLGTILKQLSTVTGFLSKRLGAGNITDGFFKAFDAAGGSAAITNIFKDISKMILNALKEILPRIPIEMYMLGMLTILIPAIIKGLTFGLSQAVIGFFQGKGNNFIAKSLGGMGGAKVTGGGRRGGGGLGLFGADWMMGGNKKTKAMAKLTRMKVRQTMRTGYTSPIGPLPAGSYNKLTGKGALMPFMNAGVTNVAKVGKGVTKLAQFMKPLGALAKVGKAVPGGALLFGGVDAAMRMASGQDAGRAIGGAASGMTGSVIGAAIGTAILPGLGTAIGGVLGGLGGDALFNKLFPETAEQAANKQLEAARLQMEAVNKRVEEASGVGLGAAGNLTSDPMKFAQVVKMLTPNLGQADAQALKDLEPLVANVRATTDLASGSAEILNAEITRLKNLNYDETQIKNDVSVKRATAAHEENQKAAEDAAKALRTAFDNLPQKVSFSVSNAMMNMDTSAISSAIASKINMVNPMLPGLTPTLQPNGTFASKLSTGSKSVFCSPLTAVFIWTLVFKSK